MLEIIRTLLPLGLPQPVKLLHITDTHITEADSSDTPSMKELIEMRRRTFVKEGGNPPFPPQHYLKEAMAMAEAEGAFPILTGDILDLNSAGGRTVLHDCLDGKDFLFTAGTHEFQRSSCTPRCCPLEEEGSYYEDTRAALQKEFPWNWDSDSRVIGGVNLITLDNSQGFFTLEAYEFLQKELEKGLPVLLFMHVPLVCETLKRLPYRPPYEFYRFSPEEYAISRKAVELIESSPLVKATFAGHWHTAAEYPHHCPPSFVTPGTFKGTVRLIELL